MQTIIYTRRSARPSTSNGDSIELQLERCRAYAAEHAWDIIEEIREEGLSGASEDRPGLWQALGGLKRGMVLLVWRRDRLARSVFLDELINKTVRKAGASIVAVEGSKNGDTAEDTFIRQVLAAFSEFERKVIAARTKSAMQRYQAQGRRMSSRCPYGWEQDPQDPKQMIPSEREARIVREIIRRDAEGQSAATIARLLNESGERNRSGGEWHRVQIQRVVKHNALT